MLRLIKSMQINNVMYMYIVSVFLEPPFWWSSVVSMKEKHVAEYQYVIIFFFLSNATTSHVLSDFFSSSSSSSFFLLLLLLLLLRNIHENFEAKWLLYVPPVLTFNNSSFCPHRVFMCFVWFSEQTAIISLYCINWLVFITETVSVYCAVILGV